MEFSAIMRAMQAYNSYPVEHEIKAVIMGRKNVGLEGKGRGFDGVIPYHKLFQVEVLFQ